MYKEKCKLPKVLKHKTYESIGHLSKSRLGPGDHSIDSITEKYFTSEVPNQQTLVVVQEKMDGSNVTVLKKDGKLHTLGRSGYPCYESDQEQHKMFHDYVLSRADEFYALLGEGERVVGEWMALAHGTIYSNVRDPFMPFDIFDSSNKRIPFIELTKRLGVRFNIPFILHIGGACSIGRAERIMKKAFPGKDYEGFVFRLEEQGEFKSIAKFVRPGKEDGKYIKPDENGLRTYVWNWRPE